MTVRTNQLQEYVDKKYGCEFKYSYGNRGDSLFYARKDERLQENFILNPSETQI